MSKGYLFTWTLGTYIRYIWFAELLIKNKHVLAMNKRFSKKQGNEKRGVYIILISVSFPCQMTTTFCWWCRQHSISWTIQQNEGHSTIPPSTMLWGPWRTSMRYTNSRWRIPGSWFPNDSLYCYGISEIFFRQLKNWFKKACMTLSMKHMTGKSSVKLAVLWHSAWLVLWIRWWRHMESN